MSAGSNDEKVFCVDVMVANSNSTRNVISKLSGVVLMVINMVNLRMGCCVLLCCLLLGCNELSNMGEAKISKISVPIIRINEAERAQYFKNGYNNPIITDEKGKDRFRDEYYETLSAIEDGLETRWVRSFRDDGDFWTNSDFYYTRFLAVEISSPRMILPDVIEIVHNVVVSTQEKYSIDICNAWGVSDLPEFNIMIEKEAIKVYTESEEIIQKFGLNREVWNER